MKNENTTEVRFLLDTNIGIQLEEIDQSSGEIRSAFKKLAELCHKHGIKLYHHPDSFIDLENDKDLDRKKATKSRFGKYPQLKKVPHGEASELEELFTSIDNSNDLIDCQILYSLKRDCIEYLISEDNGIHKRAKYADLNERVFTVNEAISFLSRFYSEDTFTYPRTEKVKLSDLDSNDIFFDSLKEDYSGFSKWFLEMQNKGEECWIIRSEEKLAAICIIEDKGIGKLPYRPRKKTLKACTFKVSDDFRGNKYGELLLKNLFQFCSVRDYDIVYLTTFTKQTGLTYLLKDFGFQLGPTPRKNGELEFFKTFHPPGGDHPRVDPIDFHKKWYPYFYDDKNINKYIIPIQPQYHNILFPEICPTPPLFEDVAKLTPGNTIKKAYLCHSPTKELEKGSLILFYRSSPEQKLTTLAIVEKTERFTDLATLLQSVGKRSVYSIKQMEEMLKKEVLMIRFRVIQHLPHQFHNSELKELNVFKTAPMSILSISQESYFNLKIKPGEHYAGV